MQTQHQDRRDRERAIGERIKNARESVGLTQAELGEALEPKVGNQTISNIEVGKTFPSVKRILQIEWICNADPGYILSGDGQLHGGVPRLNPPTATELDLTQRVSDLERELAVLRQELVAGGLIRASRSQSEDEQPRSGTG